uniref:Uncharacterized protein n=1 Tax=Arundo donax TaxID=35708 RepID=A0A0A9BCE6_ARUDO
MAHAVARSELHVVGAQRSLATMTTGCFLRVC